MNAGYVHATKEVLGNVGVGLPPKNNPIFGVVKGNPVILVIDESTSMDANFTVGDDTFTLRKFCRIQLEKVLEGLPNGTYFNVIRYSSSVVQTFQKPVLVSKISIDAAMERWTWRNDYTPGQDPVEMLREIKIFGLGIKHRVNRSTRNEAMEALQLAYATADLPLQLAADGQNTPRGKVLGSLTYTLMKQDTPQIYFLASGRPDGGARQILNKIDEFDNGRNIPVNSIALIAPADHEAKQFVKDLANKTGGFFRSIEQPGRQLDYSSGFRVAPGGLIALVVFCSLCFVA